MKEFLKETFRPNTESEWQAIRRYHRRRAVIGLIGMAVALALVGMIALTKTVAQSAYRGTWVAYDDYRDGFHPEDVYLELREGTFYRNDNHWGELERAEGRDVIPVRAPAGFYYRYLTAHGDELTIEYRLPSTAYTNPATAATFNYATDIAKLVQEQEEKRNVVEMYVRISEECRLTDEQRDALY